MATKGSKMVPERARESSGTGEQRIRDLEDALTDALAVIESYQADIRQSELHANRAATQGVSLDQVGFCQGRIYRAAGPKLRAVLEATRHDAREDGDA